MKYKVMSVAAMMAACAFSNAQTMPGSPESNGLPPKTETTYINGNGDINNFSTEHLTLDIAGNGNVIVGWEDDGSGISDIEAVWTMLDPSGVMITPMTLQTNRSLSGNLADYQTVTTRFMNYFRADGTATPGYTGWGPRVKANRFGPGFAFGAMVWELGLEIPELYDINEDAGGPPPDANDFPVIQLMNDNGTPHRSGPVSGLVNSGLLTFTDANVQPAGSIRIGGFDYLANGNVVIVGDSRQADDRALTGQAAGNITVYRVLTAGGTEVKAYSAASATADASTIARNGVGVTANGFGIRWAGPAGATVRLFDNSGNPSSTNLPLAILTGHPEAAGGGDAGNAGFSGNGKDAYVSVGDYSAAIAGTNGIWVTVLNANGTVRWSRDVAEDISFLPGTVTGCDAAINENGEVVVVFSGKIDPNLLNTVLGRRFDATGHPVGGTFYISEKEIPDVNLPPFAANRPRVSWRNGKVAVAWESQNDPALGNATEVAVRLFTSSVLPGKPENNGLLPKTGTSYVNGTNGVNNGSTEALGVGIAQNGNVLVSWEDDGSDMADIEAVWTMFDATGKSITPATKIDSFALGVSVTNNYLSFFRPNGTPTPGYVSWGPKIHANLFGSGIGMGAIAMDGLGAEIADYASYVGNGDFPAVQLLTDSGAPVSAVAGASSAYAATAGSIRIGDWEYLSNGNIVIAGDSRQNDDLVNKYGGAAPANHSIYRIMSPAGAVVKAESIVSSPAVSSGIWHGVGVTKDGFAVRFLDNTKGSSIRLFDNNGNGLTTNVLLSSLIGYAQAGGGGRGDSIGFHGNGKDAYVLANDYTVGNSSGFWVTVLNANGTVRWTRDVSDDLALLKGGTGRGDAAIDENGQVIVVFSAKIVGYPSELTLGRRFDAAGNPQGGTFYLSEKEVPDLINPPLPSTRPRIAWRNGSAAVVWQSSNYPDALMTVVAQRYFGTGAPSLTIAHIGSSVKVSWAAGISGYTLMSSSSLATGATWTAVAGVANNSVTIASPAGAKFYRLQKQ